MTGTPRLHVLLVPDWYPSRDHPFTGLFMRDLAQAIATRNAVTVLAPPTPCGPREQIEDGIRVRRMPTSRFSGAAAGLTSLRALNSTVVDLRRAGQTVDVVHAHIFTKGFLAVVVGKFRRLPVVITENFSQIADGGITGWQAPLARLTYRSADRVAPVSPFQERALRGFEPGGRYEVVPEVVDVDAFRNPARSHRAGPGRRILAVSNLVARKGLADLIEAFRLLISDGRDAELGIVGEGPERSTLERQATGLPVAFHGSRSREQIRGHLQEADVFAMPTLADPFGIAAVEALAARVPVVVTTTCGCADIVAPYGARLVPPASPKSLRDALDDLLQAPNSVGPEVADKLKRECGYDAVGERWDSIYRSVVR